MLYLRSSLPFLSFRSVTRACVDALVRPQSGAKLSSIEQLPLEILETIFTYAPNIALPLCNRGLGRALANEKMFMVCASAWLVYQGRVEAESPSTHESEAIKQANQVLAARWMTWPRFQRVVGAIISETARASEADDEVAPQFDFDRPYLQPIPTSLKLGPDLQIPSKLLHGPWSTDKSKFLSCLCFLELKVDWDRSLAGEVATAGLEEAIIARDRRAVIALLSDHVLVLPTPDMFRRAIMDHGCDQTIVFHLLLACIRAKARESNGHVAYGTLKVNPLDSVIWAWLKRFEGGGNTKAAWLKEALKMAGSLMRDTATNISDKHQDFRSRCGLPEHGVEDIPVPVDHIV